MHLWPMALGKFGVKTLFLDNPSYPAQIFGCISLENTMAAYRGIASMMDIVIEVITD